MIDNQYTQITLLDYCSDEALHGDEINIGRCAIDACFHHELSACEALSLSPKGRVKNSISMHKNSIFRSARNESLEHVGKDMSHYLVFKKKIN